MVLATTRGDRRRVAELLDGNVGNRRRIARELFDSLLGELEAGEVVLLLGNICADYGVSVPDWTETGGVA